MDEVTRIRSENTEAVPWAEIRARYPDQYVCLVDVVPVEARSPEILTARVVGHGPTSDAAFEPIRHLAKQYPLHEMRFTGICTEPLRRPSPVIDDEIFEFLYS